MGIFDKSVQLIEVEVHSNFAANLVKARSRTTYTQQSLAKDLGCSRAAVANWEVGKAIPPLEMFVKWCQLVKTTPNQVLGFLEITEASHD